MKSTKLLSAIAALIFSFGIANAQNISISDVSHTADASAVLDVYSTSLGMLVPRLSSAPSSPATGLLYYDTGSNSFKYNAGTSSSPSWTELSYGNLWSRSGSNTYMSNPGDNLLIGTNFSSGLKFYVHSPVAGQVSRFDGKVEFFDYDAAAGGNLLAEIDRIGSTQNGVLNVYNGTATNIASLTSVSTSAFGSFQTTAGNAYSNGIITSDNTFVLQNSASIATGAQNDGLTMMKSYNSGIVDFDNQSRARVFQTMNPFIQPPIPSVGQIIPFATWTEVNFDQLSYDTHLEWNLATNPAAGPSYFKVTQDGYYQVNARVDFILGYVEEQQGEVIPIHNPNYPGYVSIAIYVSTDNGQTWNMYAQGNKLQGADNNNGGWNDLQNNLAPNISDVVELHQNDLIDIRVWQDLGINQVGQPTGIPLRVLEQNGAGGNSTQVYCSIHKAS